MGVDLPFRQFKRLFRWEKPDRPTKTLTGGDASVVLVRRPEFDAWLTEEEISVRLDVREAKADEVDPTWVEAMANLKRMSRFHHAMRSSPKVRTLFFESEEIALLFKLRWCE